MDVMIVAVSRDDSVLSGGISSGRLIAHEKVAVEPFAWLSPGGEWKAIDCDEGHPQACKTFDREYLSKPQVYTVVSADGRGAKVSVDEMELDDECFGYGGLGVFSGAPISYADVAASSTEFITIGSPATRLPDAEAEPIRKAFAEAAGEKLDATVEMYQSASTEKIDPTLELRIYSVQLEGQKLLIVQRAFQDWANKPEYHDPQTWHFQLDSVFAVGRMEQGRFVLLYWQKMEDGNQQFLGLIRLKSGKDFLIETVSDPETQFFRVYGIRDGKIALVFQGGGGGC